MEIREKVIEQKKITTKEAKKKKKNTKETKKRSERSETQFPLNLFSELQHLSIQLLKNEETTGMKSKKKNGTPFLFTFSKEKRDTRKEENRSKEREQKRREKQRKKNRKTRK